MIQRNGDSRKIKRWLETTTCGYNMIRQFCKLIWEIHLLFTILAEFTSHLKNKLINLNFYFTF